MNNNLHILIILILFIAMLSAFLNEKILKLSETTGFTIFSMLFSFLITICLKFSIEHSFFKYINLLENSIKNIPFQEIVLNYFVGYLLFATTLHMNVLNLKQIAKNISYLATIGVIISAFATGALLFGLFYILNITIPFSACLIFGALISPTDPVAVISALKNNKSIPIRTKRIILGESLFNDATGILLLTILTTIFIENGVITTNFNSINIDEISHLFLNEVLISILIAATLGIFFGKFIILKTKNSSTALLITLFVSGLLYNICNIYHFSAPLAMVVLGLTIGHYLRISNVDNKKIEDFWTFVDDLLNSCLFVLIGLKILTLNISLYWLLLGICAILIIMVSRYISIIFPSILIKSKCESIKNLHKKSLLMTFGGVRGGISLALALSIDGLPNLIICITYSVVVLSIIIQSYIFEMYSKKAKIYWE